MKKFQQNLTFTVAILALLFVTGCSSKIKLTDSRDGKTYSAVKIGNQIWMQENLAFNSIPGCWAYEHKTSYVNEFGYLYSWEKACEVCPEGWKLPTKEDYYELFDYLKENNDNLFNPLGYNAKIGGWRYGNDKYTGMKEHASYWTSSDRNSSSAHYWGTNADGISAALKDGGKAVRCIKVETTLASEE
ncbi:FISUMP domain-containing protein [Flammeovirga aprica]|uniref:Fibrobacter succinogenes major paralogous domain-containing protein n=1 Tax=Flammeovirga aprica JL-4 TaxID=694437 RepID=A0A7X9RZM6_9BACT|nr:FISUMP domain-containing protein [Flammeovirga aprica]NME71688.1 hypothetical protein [Flammeovirga aprica JL-4]